MNVLIVIAALIVVVSALGYTALRVKREKDEPVFRRPSWYEYGPWKVTSNGEQICMQKGAEDPKPVYIVNEDLWGFASKAARARDHVTTTSYHSHRRVAYVDDIPLIKLRCEMLNEAAHKAAEAAGWAELGAEV